MKGGRFCAPSDGDALPSYQTVLRKAPATLQCGLLPTDRLYQERETPVFTAHPGQRGTRGLTASAAADRNEEGALWGRQ